MSHLTPGSADLASQFAQRTTASTVVAGSLFYPLGIYVTVTAKNLNSDPSACPVSTSSTEPSL